MKQGTFTHCLVTFVTDFASLLPVFLFEYIKYLRFDIFLMIKYKLYLELYKNDMEEGCCQRKTPASDKTKYFSLKTKENWETCQCLEYSLLQRIYSFRLLSFLMYKENWYVNNKRTSIFYYMALHFSNFHHHIEVFDYRDHLISERILNRV